MGMTLLLLLFLLHLLNSRPTRCFNGMTHSERPACRMHQGTPRVTPKIGDGVVRGIALVCIHQLQATTNYCHNAGYSGSTHMLGVHNLNARAHFDRGLHAFGQLGRACENGCLRKKQKSLSFEDKSNASLPLPLCRSQQGECWPPPALTSDMLSSLGCSASHLCAHSLTDQMNASVWATCTHTHISLVMADFHSALNQNSHLGVALTACSSWHTIQLGLLLPKRGCTRSRGCCHAQNLHSAEEPCILDTKEVKSPVVPLSAC